MHSAHTREDFPVPELHGQEGSCVLSFMHQSLIHGNLEVEGIGNELQVIYIMMQFAHERITSSV